MWKPSKQRRAYPYYKVQVHNDTSLTWKDERGAFDSVEDAQEYISAKIGSEMKARIMVVDQKGRRVLE